MLDAASVLRQSIGEAAAWRCISLELLKTHLFVSPMRSQSSSPSRARRLKMRLGSSVYGKVHGCCDLRPLPGRSMGERGEDACRGSKGCMLPGTPSQEAKAAAAAKAEANAEGTQEGLMICSCCYRLDRCSSSGEAFGTGAGGAAAATARGGWDP